MDLLVKCAYMQTKCINKLKTINIYTRSKSKKDEETIYEVIYFSGNT